MFEQHESRENFITIPGSVDVSGIDAYKAGQDKDSLRRLHGIDPKATVVSLVGTFAVPPVASVSSNVRWGDRMRPVRLGHA